MVNYGTINGRTGQLKMKRFWFCHFYSLNIINNAMDIQHWLITIIIFLCFTDFINRTLLQRGKCSFCETKTTPCLYNEDAWIAIEALSSWPTWYCYCKCSWQLRPHQMLFGKAKSIWQMLVVTGVLVKPGDHPGRHSLSWPSDGS